MSQQPFYDQRVNSLQEQLKTLKKRINLMGTIRLLIFISVGLATYFFWDMKYAVVSTIVIGTLVFFWLIQKHAAAKSVQRYQTALLEINKTELRVLARDLSQQKTGGQYMFEQHDFNQDIDLFGEGSLFQYINRTALPNGEKHLADWLNSNEIDAIEEKQLAIKELAALTDWRQDYSARAALIDSDINSDSVTKWIKSHERFVPKLFAWFPLLFSAISVLAIVAYFTDFISGYWVFAWYLTGIAITGRYLTRITYMYNTTSKINDLLEQYAKLLLKIEQSEFKSARLKEWQQTIVTEGLPASKILAQLSQEVNSLDNRNNMIFAFVANGLLLWDLRFSYRIEKWLASYDGALSEWFKIIETFDAMNSMSNYAFNNETYCYPTITSEPKIQFKAENLGHPLLSSEKMITNSIALNQEDFFIITGANMAGKSTFLRTVAMNLVMANCGLPVRATHFDYRPIKLISSMRTSDSLVNDESYFFSELKRLKFIVDRIETDTYFIILDEILKGTNSVDKAEGSKKFVKRLVNSKSTGLIATHDLSLCTLSEEFDHIENHYFDAEIVDDELYFDYRFKTGICQNMNASFLLKKMKIVE